MEFVTIENSLFLHQLIYSHKQLLVKCLDNYDQEETDSTASNTTA